jgi:hypothetical protein
VLIRLKNAEGGCGGDVRARDAGRLRRPPPGPREAILTRQSAALQVEDAREMALRGAGETRHGRDRQRIGGTLEPGDRVIVSTTSRWPRRQDQVRKTVPVADPWLNREPRNDPVLDPPPGRHQHVLPALMLVGGQLTASPSTCSLITYPRLTVVTTTRHSGRRSPERC